MRRWPDVLLGRMALDVGDDAMRISQAWSLTHLDRDAIGRHGLHCHSLGRGAFPVVLGTLRGLPPGDVRDVTNGIVVFELVGADLNRSAMVHLHVFNSKAFLGQPPPKR